MAKKRALTESTTPTPIKELAILANHPLALLNQNTDDPLSIPSIMLKQFHQLQLQDQSFNVTV